jgi:flagellar biosynthesis protein FlhF
LELILVQYQTFRGSNVNEALAAVRAAFGPEAVIDSTRYVTNGRRGALGHSYVEVSAAPPGESQKPYSAASTVATPVRTAGARAASSGRTIPLAQAVSPVRDEGRTDPTLGFDASAIEQELRSLRALVDELTAGRTPRDQALTQLRALGIEGDYARQILKGKGKTPTSPSELRGFLRSALASELKVVSGLLETTGPRLLACVGPTGAGKTTTLAKIAARARLDLGVSVGVISLDTHRVGATEQWKRYARLLGIPFHVATDAQSFARAAAEIDCELLLVDTPGRSPSDESDSWMLPECLKQVDDREIAVLAVLPAWLTARDAARVLNTYQTPAPAAVVLTKLDEASTVGGALQAAAGSELPIAFLCGGPRVPDDLADASVESVLDAVFGKPS